MALLVARLRASGSPSGSRNRSERMQTSQALGSTGQQLCWLVAWFDSSTTKTKRWRRRPHRLAARHSVHRHAWPARRVLGRLLLVCAVDRAGTVCDPHVRADWFLPSLLLAQGIQTTRPVQFLLPLINRLHAARTALVGRASSQSPPPYRHRARYPFAAAAWFSVDHMGRFLTPARIPALGIDSRSAALCERARSIASTFSFDSACGRAVFRRPLGTTPHLSRY
jgi:hypothetical protein